MFIVAGAEQVERENDKECGWRGGQGLYHTP